MKKRNTNQIPEEKDERAMHIASKSKSNKLDGNSSPEDTSLSSKIQRKVIKNVLGIEQTHHYIYTDDVREALFKFNLHIQYNEKREELLKNFKEIFGEELTK